MLSRPSGVCQAADGFHARRVVLRDLVVSMHSTNQHLTTECSKMAHSENNDARSQRRLDEGFVNGILCCLLRVLSSAQLTYLLISLVGGQR